MLLVCEGPTDYYILEEVAKKLSTPEKALTFQMIQPQIDATSGSVCRGGWSQVINWCRHNKDKINTLLAFKGAVAMFIQMDTDISMEIDPDHYAKRQTARQCCENALKTHLGARGQRDDCHYILPTQKTETWLLALHDEKTDPAVFPEPIQDYETISDVESKLLATGVYARKRSSVKKSPARRYKAYGERLAARLPVARRRCSELDAFCTQLENL
tara:strand:- start:107 stop:751 length:645 start_codon:yes stop_codon:yes gene_type:complete